MQAHRGKVLALVVAGGEGEGLKPLTENRAKPALPFGDVYRLIDFPSPTQSPAGDGMRPGATVTCSPVAGTTPSR